MELTGWLSLAKKGEFSHYTLIEYDHLLRPAMNQRSESVNRSSKMWIGIQHSRKRSTQGIPAARGGASH